MTRTFCTLSLLLLGAVCQDCDDDVPTMMLLQTHQVETKKESKSELEMAYVPFNFGHTVSEKVAKLGIMWGDCGSREAQPGCLGWQIDATTGCHLMYVPAKHWPQELAKSTFGNRSVFGILRDPYERMVAQFRGTYRFQHPEFGCDVDAGVKQMMKEYIAAVEAGNPWASDCNFLPQAEFFDQPFGASIVVDNRPFPDSMNEIFQQHGYPIKILTEEVSHVGGCDSKWAADLSPETKALIYKVYRRDFDLLCQQFGYCDPNENVCLTRVPEMCPPQLFTWNEGKKVYEPNSL